MAAMLALLSFTLGVLLLLAPGPAAAASASQRAGGEVVVLTVNDAITPVVARYVERGIGEAEQAGAQAVVLRLDTPGGLDTAMRAIIQRILSSRVPVIVYVSPTGARAASAGTFIAYAAHVAAMAPSTTIGSASPVAIGESGQEQQQSDTMKAKVTNDAVAYIRGLAERRGRNADWAERAVREAANLPATEAAGQNVVDFVAADLDEVLRKAEGRTVRLEVSTTTLRTEGAAVRLVEPTWAESFLQLIANPTVAYLLLSLALLGLYLEFANPGSFLPGITGAILLILALFALGSLPVNWAGLLLMVLAFALFTAEVFLPTHGALAIGGLTAFVLGSLLLIDASAGPLFQIAPSAIAGVALSLGLAVLAVVVLIVRDRRRRPVTGREGLIGAVAVVRRRLEPAGMVFVEGELWHAVSQDGPVEPGQPVRVVAVRGLNLIVTPSVEETPVARKEQPT